MIPPTILYEKTTFVYIISSIFQYNDNCKDKGNTSCPYHGNAAAGELKRD